MMKRPLCFLFLLAAAGIWLLHMLGIPLSGQSPGYAELGEALDGSVQVSGTLYRREDRSIYLKQTILKASSVKIPIQNIRIFVKEEVLLPVGARVCVKGAIKPVEEPRNPGEFDSRLYYETQHIYFLLFAEEVTREGAQFSRLGEWLAKTREQMRQVFVQAAPQESGVFSAMLLGDKSLLDAEVKAYYQMSGIIHMLAISGLHLSLLGMGCYRLLQRAGAPIGLAGGVSMILLFAYGILTGGSVSTMRALLMFVISMGAKVLGRTYDLPSALSLAGLLLLVESPGYLFYSGFLLSFGAVLGVAVIYPMFEGGIPRLLKPLAASLTVQMVTIPVVLSFFYEVPLYGILMNVLLVPSLGGVLVCGLAGSVTGMFSIGVAKVVLFPGCLLAAVYEKAGVLVSKLPYTTLVLGKPDLWQAVLYYLLLGSGAFLLHRALCGRSDYEGDSGSIGQAAGSAAGLYIGAALLTALGSGLLLYRPVPEFAIICLDVGQGDGLVIRSGRDCYLSDGGSTNVSQVGNYRILPYLKSQGISRVRCAFVSHTDEDHISGIREIMEQQASRLTSVHLQCLALPKWEQKPDAYRELEQLAAQAGITVVYLERGSHIEVGKVDFTALAPGEEWDQEDVNAGSLVLLVRYGDFQGLLTGDIGEEQEEQLAEEYGKTNLFRNQAVDFLKVAHHGSKYSTSEGFLAWVRPRASVISCSAKNRYGHPGKQTIERLKKINTSIFYTKYSGAVTVKIKRGKLLVEGYR